jgi:hypothetical protein
MKRFRAATMGRANRIKKRTSHIQLELDVKGGALVPAKNAPKAAPKKTESPAAPKAEKKEKKSGAKKMVGAK